LGCFALLPLKVMELLGRVDSYLGFRIPTATFKGRTVTLFTTTVQKSLDLIHETDPRRFERLRHYVRWIVAAPLRGDSSYLPLGRICALNMASSMRHRSEEVRVKCVAISLIGQSARAALLARLGCLARTRLSRVSDVCLAEELRFARRLKADDIDWDALIHARYETWPSGNLRPDSEIESQTS